MDHREEAMTTHGMDAYEAARLDLEKAVGFVSVSGYSDGDWAAGFNFKGVPYSAPIHNAMVPQYGWVSDDGWQPFLAPMVTPC